MTDVRSRTGTPVASDFTSPFGTPLVLDLTAEKAYAMNDAGTIFEVAAQTLPAVEAKSADESVTSSTVLQNDDHLLFPIAASEQWVGEIVIFAGALLSTTGAKVAITVPSGATLQASFTAGGLNSQQTTTSGAAMEYTAVNFTGFSNSTLKVQFWVLNSTNAGNVQLQWAQSTSSGTALTFKKGSYLFASKVL